MPRKSRGNGEGGKPPSRRATKKTPVEKPEASAPMPHESKGEAKRYPCPVSTSAAQLAPVELDWLVPDWIPGQGVTLICGPTNVGKTTFLAALASQVSGGPSLMGTRKGVPSGVLWYVSELDPASMLRPRLVVGQADLNRVFFPGYSGSSICQHRLSLPSELRMVHDEILHRRAALVLFDPITSFLDTECSPIDGQAVRMLLDSLSLLSTMAGVAIVATCHYRKGRGGSPLDWVAGSGCWTQCSRAVIALGEHPEAAGQHVLACAKPGLGAPPASRAFTLERLDGSVLFRLRGEVAVTARDMGDNVVGPGERDALADAKRFLYVSLEVGDRKVAELEVEANNAGISRATLRRAKEALHVESEQTEEMGNRFWIWKCPTDGWPT